MSTAQAIKLKLETVFSPTELEVKDESHLHAGHQNFDGSGGTHFRVIMETPEFEGQSRLQRHRAINQALTEELASTVHALALELTAPGETKRRG